MPPCAQPRWGFTERSKPTSGELLRVITVFASSLRTSVARDGGVSSWNQPSSSATERVGAKRLCGLLALARPRGGRETDMGRLRQILYINTVNLPCHEVPTVAY